MAVPLANPRVPDPPTTKIKTAKNLREKMVWKLLILKNWPEFGLGTTLSDMMEECDSSLYYAQNMHAN